MQCGISGPMDIAEDLFPEAEIHKMRLAMELKLRDIIYVISVSDLMKIVFHLS